VDDKREKNNENGFQFWGYREPANDMTVIKPRGDILSVHVSVLCDHDAIFRFPFSTTHGLPQFYISSSL